MMEPNLIQKFKHFFTHLNQKTSTRDLNENDTGVDYEDLRSNDMWCLGYLILISLDFEFAGLYRFDPKSEHDLISFDVDRFLPKYKQFCERFSSDQNFIYVMNSLLGLERFSEGTLTRVKVHGL